MPRRPPLARRWITAVTWPLGIALTSWDYLWRVTPLHRREVAAVEGHAPPALPDTLDVSELLEPDDGHGPLFHRRYATTIAGSRLTPEDLIAELARDPNRAAPTTFARFQKVHGAEQALEVGDEFVVRMPGPWDGPVRVVDRGPRRFRLATLRGHLEAGQIEFRAGRAEDGELTFEIESWARSGDRLAHLLYHTLRMAKEVQCHMWISFLEGVVKLARGRMRGGIVIETWRVEQAR